MATTAGDNKITTSRSTKLKFLLFIIGLLTMILGAYPLLYNAPWMPTFLTFIPTEGTLYHLSVTIMGAIAIYLSLKQ